jgi:hypothetical protein
MQKIVLNNNKSFEAFINVAGNSQETSVESHNKAVMQFIELYNAGKVSIEAFTGSDGKIVLGFK